MQYNEDKRIKINVPFLQDRIVLYIDSSIGTSHFYIEDHQDDILYKFKKQDTNSSSSPTYAPACPMS